MYEGKDSDQMFIPSIQLQSEEKIDEDRFRKALEAYFTKEIKECDRNIMDNRKQEYGLLIFSVVLFILSAMFSGVGAGIATAVLAAIGGFTSFQFCDFLLLRDRKYKLEKRAWSRLKSIKIQIC